MRPLAAFHHSTASGCLSRAAAKENKKRPNCWPGWCKHRHRGGGGRRWTDRSAAVLKSPSAPRRTILKRVHVDMDVLNWTDLPLRRPGRHKSLSRPSFPGTRRRSRSPTHANVSRTVRDAVPPRSLPIKHAAYMHENGHGLGGEYGHTRMHWRTCHVSRYTCLPLRGHRQRQLGASLF